LTQANYGKKDKDCVAAIKKIYVDLQLEAKFKEYEAETYRNLCTAIEGQKSLPKEIFLTFLDKIYQRQK
jgi:farnesyl diphosphate synthase